MCHRYMLMSVAKRKDEDERTLGELSYLMVDEAADITFNRCFRWYSSHLASSPECGKGSVP